jgi:hypothetical protein
MERWDAYFDSWKQKARTPDGRLVPMLVTIGNHEVRGSYHQPASAPRRITRRSPCPVRRDTTFWIAAII